MTACRPIKGEAFGHWTAKLTYIKRLREVTSRFKVNLVSFFKYSYSPFCSSSTAKRGYLIAPLLQTNKDHPKRHWRNEARYNNALMISVAIKLVNNEHRYSFLLKSSNGNSRKYVRVVDIIYTQYLL